MNLILHAIGGFFLGFFGHTLFYLILTKLVGVEHKIANPAAFVLMVLSTVLVYSLLRSGQ